MVPRTIIPPAMFSSAIVTLALLPSKLDIRESVASYSPQRILSQYGFDQGAVWIIGNAGLN